MKSRESVATKVGRLPTGPGVFIYDGSASDTQWIPPVYLTDEHRNPVMVKGKRVIKTDGHLERKPLDSVTVRGVTFPEGEEVTVYDAEIALKLRGLKHFEEKLDEAGLPVAVKTPKAIDRALKAKAREEKILKAKEAAAEAEKAAEKKAAKKAKSEPAQV